MAAGELTKMLRFNFKSEVFQTLAATGTGPWHIWSRAVEKEKSTSIKLILFYPLSESEQFHFKKIDGFFLLEALEHVQALVSVT